MIKILSQIISVIFHPILMPLLGIVLIFNSGSYLSYYPYEGQKAIYNIILLSTIVLPMCFIPLLYFFKQIKSAELNTRQERIIPYIITLIFYYFAYFILKRASAPNVIISVVLAAIITLSITLVISFKWKISAHMIGIGGLTGAFIALSSRMLFNITNILMLLIFVSGIIATSRLYLKAHKSSEVYVGYGAGIIVSSLIVYYL